MRIVAATLENKSIRPRIHLSYGKITDEDETAIVVSSREMIRILLQNYKYEMQTELFVFEDPIGGHDELAWGYHFQLYMLAFFGKTTNCILETQLQTQTKIETKIPIVASPTVAVSFPETLNSLWKIKKLFKLQGDVKVW